MTDKVIVDVEINTRIAHLPNQVTVRYDGKRYSIDTYTDEGATHYSGPNPTGIIWQFARIMKTINEALLAELNALKKERVA